MKLLSTLILCYVLIPATALTKPLEFSGWWAYELNGCFDVVDNQWRIALGRWESTEHGVRFGSGAESMGAWDTHCELKRVWQADNTVKYDANCTVEGEKTKGVALITVKSENTISLVLPNTSNGAKLIRCPQSIEGSWHRTLAHPSLTVRDSPSVTGKKIGSIPLHGKIKVTKQKDKDSIGGKDGKWVEIDWKGDKGYVFDAFLEPLGLPE